MAEIVQNVLPSGNTNPEGKKKQCNPSKGWCFTLNNYTESEHNKIIEQLVLRNDELLYVVGEEVGESGTPHLQGFFTMIDESRVRPTYLKLNNKRIHWESMKGTIKQNYIYCTKDGKYKTNFRRNMLIAMKLLKLTDGCELKEWQKQAVELIKNIKTDRCPIFIIGGGNDGKTFLAKYLIEHFDYGYMSNARSADIAFYVSKNIKPGYVINYTKSIGANFNYSVLEDLKDGLLFSGKYESTSLLMDSPQLIVLMNKMPHTWQTLSYDRFNHTYKIIKNGLKKMILKYDEDDAIEREWLEEQVDSVGVFNGPI